MEEEALCLQKNNVANESVQRWHWAQIGRQRGVWGSGAIGPREVEGLAPCSRHSWTSEPRGTGD